MAALAAYVRHAEQHGGARDLWETARTELEPVELGRLAEALRKIEPRRQSGNGRAVEQPFSLTRAERAQLIAQLLAARVSDSAIRRYLGVSSREVGTVRKAKVTDPPEKADLGQSPCGVSRNELENATKASTPRTCDWCGAPLPWSTLRADARYCKGGACKQAAYPESRVIRRARRPRP